MKRQRGFSLIELMVVVSILVLLMSILMPSLREVRRVSKKTVCQKNLDQIAQAMQAYLMQNKDTFPHIARCPYYEQDRARNDPDYRPLPSLPEALKKEIGGAVEAFACPADANTMMVDELKTSRYFDHEKTSYEWEQLLNGQKLGFKLVRVYAQPPGQYNGQPRPAVEIIRTEKKNMWMIYDFEPFHGGPQRTGSHNVLYTDLHVQSDQWKQNKKAGQEYRE